MFWYRTDAYKNCRDDEERVEFSVRTENELILMGCFFEACLNGTASRLFGHV